ncbi:alpha-L-fucosidase [Asticcacaulis sp. EMRT-3]|uniref:alpha-L-fucosidase n=1 Tax=Asticcacaulis sp. EMRT-3 TaxID=3040349 RepID=UPI0024AF10D3|nr:alpha-L-fucosidase [Asticcacaulis sp. EMRT-3]MDI7775079.1 alpha-L-fucosidase [Asticcacaulis sp. EMRT-3]
MVDINKRNLLGMPLVAALGLGVAGAASAAAQTDGECKPAPAPDYQLPIAPGPFKPTAASLETYQAPDWFRNAKFGIWAHWGPQAVPRQGDWYARFMYVPGHPDYDHHLKTYGHPSQFGYKDIIPLWTAEKFDPEALMDKYVAAGAKYFVSMGVHHDNFDLWNSKTHRWNAVAMGPKRDVVGEWARAARKRGLRFGVSEHLGASHNWWYPSHLYDQFWPKLGVNYDGADPKYADLYHHNTDEPYKGDAATWYTTDPAYHQMWFNRIHDLVDSYKPDLLYSDGGIPFGVVGRSLVAHLYNQSVEAGRVQAVYNCKALGSGEFYPDACVQDVERGVLKGINPLPWQTDTSNGDWFYSDNFTYKTAPEVIHMLTDIVSKNGNLLLNVVLYADGSLPPESQTLLDELAAWMKVNAEAIHDTRPWVIYGEGPTEAAGGAFHEGDDYTPQDIRFTTKGSDLYAITLGEASGRVSIAALGRKAGHEKRAVRSVHLLGADKPLKFRQTDAALQIDLPASLPTRHSSAFKISFKA